MNENKKIMIQAGTVSVAAEIYGNETGKAIFEQLPITGQVNRWGEEIYFSIPVSLPRSPDARDVVTMGELGYWPDGKAFCIFFGKTPISRGDEIRAASPVNIFGSISGDPTILATVDDGQTITVTKR